MIGNDYINPIGTYFFAPLHGHAPQRVGPGIERRPEGGEEMQNDESPVERQRDQPDQKGEGEQEDGADHQEKPEYGRSDASPGPVRPLSPREVLAHL